MKERGPSVSRLHGVKFVIDGSIERGKISPVRRIENGLFLSATDGRTWLPRLSCWSQEQCIFLKEMKILRDDSFQVRLSLSRTSKSNHFDQIGLATSPPDVRFCAHSRRVSRRVWARTVSPGMSVRLARSLSFSLSFSLSLTFRKAKRSFCSFCRSAVGCWPFPLMNLSISIRR